MSTHATIMLMSEIIPEPGFVEPRIWAPDDHPEAARLIGEVEAVINEAPSTAAYLLALRVAEDASVQDIFGNLKKAANAEAPQRSADFPDRLRRALASMLAMRAYRYIEADTETLSDMNSVAVPLLTHESPSATFALWDPELRVTRELGQTILPDKVTSARLVVYAARRAAYVRQATPTESE